MKGWEYALDNPDEAAQIVVDSDEAGAAELATRSTWWAKSASWPTLNGRPSTRPPTTAPIKALLDQKIITSRRRRAPGPPSSPTP